MQGVYVDLFSFFRLSVCLLQKYLPFFLASSHCFRATVGIEFMLSIQTYQQSLEGTSSIFPFVLLNFFWQKV